MSRRLRLEIPCGVYHVTNRGVDRADIVWDDDDRREWSLLACAYSIVSKLPSSLRVKKAVREFDTDC